MSHAAFTDALLDPERPTPAGLVDGFGGPAGKRFAVYRNNVTVSLIEALFEGFPAVAKLLGEENFRNIAREYLRREPPSSPLMMLYGKGFAGFIEGFPPLAEFGYLPDVARLEYALRESYHAADATPIAPGELGQIPPEKLGEARLTLAPSVRLLRSEWPVFSLWRYATGASSDKPQPEAQSVLITRETFDPVAQVLPAGGYEFLTALSAQKTLHDAATQATENEPAFDLPTVLSTLLETQTIVSLEH